MIYAKVAKPLFDRTLSILLMVSLSPVWLTIAAILFFVNRGQVLFRQQRPGYKGKPFYILKFKTMTDECDETGELLPDEERKTAFGNFLRRTSLDEFPQLLNVAVGHLSFVGPRPLLMEYLPLYTDEQARRHDVKPGLTGLSQINGRQTVSWKDRFDYDLYYVDNVSFWLDMKIAFMTIPKALGQDGADLEVSAASAKFTGKIEP